MSHFFLTIMKQRISLWIRCCIFSNPLWQFLVRGTFTEQRCLLINAVFCGHNILRAQTDQYCLLLNRCWRLLISGVVYKSAGYNKWSAMFSTNPRCRLQIRCVIYQSAGVNYWSAEKYLTAQNRPKKSPKPKIWFCLFI